MKALVVFLLMMGIATALPIYGSIETGSGITVNSQNITNYNQYYNGTLNGSVQCSGTDKVKNVSIINGNLSIVCATDEGGVGSGDNASWNESYANTKYANIQYNYNQSAQANTTIFNTYNTGWLSTYNVTYATWAYNMSSLFSYNHTIAANLSIFNVYDIRWSTTYNSTYATWAYNMSPTSAMLDSIYGCTEGKVLKRSGSLWECADYVSENQSWNESYANTKYSGIQWGYNQTTPANKSIYDVYGWSWINWTTYANISIFNTYDLRWSSTSNTTYSTFAYNYTAPTNKTIFDTYDVRWSNTANDTYIKNLSNANLKQTNVTNLSLTNTNIHWNGSCIIIRNELTSSSLGVC